MLDFLDFKGDPILGHRSEDEVIVRALAEFHKQNLLQGLHSQEFLERIQAVHETKDRITPNPSPQEDLLVQMIVSSLEIIGVVDLLQGLLEDLTSEGVILGMLRREIEEGAPVLTRNDQRRTSLLNQISFLIDISSIETLENSIENHIVIMLI